MSEFNLNYQAPDGPTVESTIESGQIIFLVGVNGTGKSTLMHKFSTQNENKVRRITAHRQVLLFPESNKGVIIYKWQCLADNFYTLNSYTLPISLGEGCQKKYYSGLGNINYLRMGFCDRLEQHLTTAYEGAEKLIIATTKALVA